MNQTDVAMYHDGGKVPQPLAHENHRVRADDLVRLHHVRAHALDDQVTRQQLRDIDRNTLLAQVVEVVG